MTDEQTKVFEAVSRGRLIFPFQDEMDALSDIDGELTDDEDSRLAELSDAFDKIKIKDEWFHSAMEGGDVDTAARVAGEALKICEDLA